MSMQRQLGQQLVNRLEAIIGALPKEGYKAAVAVGVADSILTLVNEARELASKIECLGSHKGKCSQEFCDSSCGGLFLGNTGELTIIAKYSSNPFAVKLGNSIFEADVQGAKLVLEGSTVKAGIIGEKGYVWETVDLSNMDEVYEKSYTLKYVLRKVGKPVLLARTALRYCMIQSAVSC